MNRLPIKLTIEQCDLDSDDEITLTEKDVAGASGKVAPSGTRGRRYGVSMFLQLSIFQSQLDHFILVVVLIVIFLLMYGTLLVLVLFDCCTGW